MDSETDNEKVNMPSFPSPEPIVSYFDDLDFLKDFENEFPVIVYNDALTSKSDSSTEPVEIHHHMALPPRDQRHRYLRFEGLQYTDADIIDFETRMLMEHKVTQGQGVFIRRAWRRLFDIQGPLVHELILEFFSNFRFGEAVSRKSLAKKQTIWFDYNLGRSEDNYCPPARTAKKIEKINNFQEEPNENLYQAWERFKELLMKCPQHYLTEMQEVVLFYNRLDVPTRELLDSRGAIPSKIAADAKIAIQEMAKYS
uniref:Retrotransposon gag domain-containing protein n=1 Tax=Tanacetum cinerariifolium TaxID=118510 RepID=A0A6L2KNZ7_TANCI|nr:hypothetical protein [Tanacetum cinerariifolium]